MQQLTNAFPRFWYVGVALACIVGAVFVLGATSRGVGLSPDSVQYLTAAQSAADGRGLITYAWEGEPKPLTHFPPAYPLTLTAAARLGWSSAGFARWFNVGLFALTIVIAVVMTLRLAPHSPWPALSTAALYAAAHDLVVAHSMAWTEPLYLTLTLIGCLILADAIERNAWRLLVVAAVLAGLSAVVRYVGVANIGVVGLAVLLWLSGSWWRRLRMATVASIVAAIPLLGALALGTGGAGVDAGAPTGEAGGVANRQLGWHPLDAHDLRMLASVIGKWVSPLSDATYLTAVWLTGLAVLVAALLVGRSRANRTGDAPRPSRPALMRVMWLYVAAYMAVLILSMTLADAQTEFDGRLLVPALAVTLVLGVVWLRPATTDTRDVRLTARAIVALVLVAELSRVLPWQQEARRYGLGLRRLNSTDRQIVAATRQLPREARVYSNRPYFLRVQTSRMVPGLPRERDPNSLLLNPRYAEQVRQMCDETATRETFVVLFSEQESEDPAANGDVVGTNGNVSVLPSGRVIKVRQGCRE
ncbi:MAG: ArnT family glycosyltransferase [Gemmatimonadaceae bacterium]